jgi:hypothetical protein
MKNLNALIVGRGYEMVMPLLDILSTAGFKIDCISTRKGLRSHHLINNFYSVKNNEDLLQRTLDVYRNNQFDLVVIADDETNKIIKDSSFPLSYKESLLPVVSKEYFNHISSKIGLSKALEKFKIRTPNFIIINNNLDILNNYQSIGFPFMLKGDFSGGGNQTVEINNQSELNKIIQEFNYFPAVMQKKVEGDLIGIEALFIEKELVHFSYSRTLKTLSDNKFTPSVVREYSQLGILHEEIFQEINSLGKALGINGFVNISCIRSPSDKHHYYFEADVRPTAWIGHTKYFGDNLGIRLRDYLNQGVALSYPVEIDKAYPVKIILPYYLRFTTFELIMNRYAVWKYIPRNRLAFYLLFKKHVLRNIEGLITLRPIRRALYG